MSAKYEEVDDADEEDRPQKRRKPLPPRPQDDDDDEPKSRHRRSGRKNETDEESPISYTVLLPAELFTVAKVCLLGLGGIIALAAFIADTVIQTAALSGLACYVGIMARIVQAEECRVIAELRYRREKQNQPRSVTDEEQ